MCICGDECQSVLLSPIPLFCGCGLFHMCVQVLHSFDVIKPCNSYYLKLLFKQVTDHAGRHGCSAVSGDVYFLGLESVVFTYGSYCCLVFLHGISTSWTWCTSYDFTSMNTCCFLISIVIWWKHCIRRCFDCCTQIYLVYFILVGLFLSQQILRKLQYFYAFLFIINIFSNFIFTFLKEHLAKLRLDSACKIVAGSNVLTWSLEGCM